ncbi:unnamed protein product [Rhizoctonia solani]|uniref:Secreted protein n=1 Tax=Rhizoctonia solani TaxID=456999 RepID=A0A8H2W8U9_9AGAM|nr:unnamed protein product [Rhizoctonia solani]
MKLFAVMPVLVTLVTKATGSPSSRLRMLNQSQLQGEGCKLLRRACPTGHRVVMSAREVSSAKLGYAFQAISKELHGGALPIAVFI